MFLDVLAAPPPADSIRTSSLVGAASGSRRTTAGAAATPSSREEQRGVFVKTAVCGSIFAVEKVPTTTTTLEVPASSIADPFDTHDTLVSTTIYGVKEEAPGVWLPQVLSPLRLGQAIEVPSSDMESARRAYGPRAVFLHVYDLDETTKKLNAVSMATLGTGVFHVGLELFGDEWYYRQGFRNESGRKTLELFGDEWYYRQGFRNESGRKTVRGLPAGVPEREW